jgi:bifunctional non-homologous end joining protein LigD
MRTRWPGEENLVFMAFDLLHQDGVNLQKLALSKRKQDLHRLCAKSRLRFLREVQTFPNGALLLEHCDKFGFEGVVSKRLDRPMSAVRPSPLGEDKMPRLEAQQPGAIFPV